MSSENKQQYVVFEMTDNLTPESLDKAFERVYASADRQSLIFIFKTSKLKSFSATRLVGLIPVIKKHKLTSELKLIESHVIIENKLLYKLLKCFLQLPFVSTARPVKLHMNSKFIDNLDTNIQNINRTV